VAPLLAIARASYFLAVVISTIIVFGLCTSLVDGLTASRRSVSSGGGSHSIVVAIFLVAFLIPCYRACLRVVRRERILSPSGIEFGIYTVLVTLFVTVGHLFSFLGAWAIIDWMIKNRDAPKQAVLAFMIAGLLYLIGLWIGEFVIMRVTNRVTTEPIDVSSNS
jgi:hypothetical protein